MPFNRGLRNKNLKNQERERFRIKWADKINTFFTAFVQAAIEVPAALLCTIKRFDIIFHLILKISVVQKTCFDQ